MSNLFQLFVGADINKPREMCWIGEGLAKD